MKTIDTLIQDIYKLVETKEIPEGVDADKAIEDFGEAVKQLMIKEFKNYTRDKRTLRLSNIGRDSRFLWNLVNNPDVQEKIQPHTYIKFMYGHLIEELLLCLTKLAGHTVTDEQKQCEVEGIKGHMDCKIDGIVTDVKSTSTYSFKKFKDETLAANDSFGYIGQIKAYAHAEGQTRYGWLAMDKQNGHLTYLLYDEKNKEHPMFNYLDYDIVKQISNIKELVTKPEPPEFCETPEPDGKSGNMKLTVKCSYCPYKQSCYPEVRTFIYSTGPRYLTKVEKVPNVVEVGNGSF